MRVVFFGTPEFAAVSLEAVIASRHKVVAVVAQPDRPAGRGMKLQKPPTALLAEAGGLPLMQPAKIRTPEFVASIRALAPDIGVVVAYGRILPADLLAAAPRGFVNVHGSILPFYRGAAPIQRAIERGEKETGVSIMRLDAELDHGPVFAIARTPIEPDERTPQLAARLARIGARALVETLDAIEAGTATETEQDHSRATFAAKIEKEEGAVRWTEDARAIYDRFRAFDPWPGLFVTVDGEPLKLVEIGAVAGARGEPGTILAISGDDLIVAAGSGALRLTKVQRPGKGPVTGAAYANGRRIVPGTRLE